MIDGLLLVAGLGILLITLAVAGGFEDRINEFMGWTDDHRSARRRNKR